MVTGAAPISPNVLTFLRACLGCQVWKEEYNNTKNRLTIWLLFWLIKDNVMQYCFIVYLINMATVKQGVYVHMYWSGVTLTQCWPLYHWPASRYSRLTARQSAQRLALSQYRETGKLVGFCIWKSCFFLCETTLSTDLFCVLLISGHVGIPIPCNIVKLVDVEEMNYFASNDEGEVMEHHFIIHILKCHWTLLWLWCFILGLYQREECVSWISRWPRKDSRGFGQRWMAAHWRYRQMAACEIPWFLYF